MAFPGLLNDAEPLLKNAARSLRPNGRLGVVDFLPGGGGPGPAPDQRIDAKVTAASTRSGNHVARWSLRTCRVSSRVFDSSRCGSSPGYAVSVENELMLFDCGPIREITQRLTKRRTRRDLRRNHAQLAANFLLLALTFDADDFDRFK